jgi:hypothetical protein
LLSTALLWSCGAAALAADPDMFWFKNETQCGDAKIVVRSYCEVSQRANAVVQANSGCTEQELVIAQPGKKTVKRDLLSTNRWATISISPPRYAAWKPASNAICW